MGGDGVEAVETPCDALERPAALHLDEAPLIDSEVAGVLGGHEPVLIEGALEENVVDPPRHGAKRVSSASG